MGRVGFDGFIILWPKPNPTRYKKKKFVTQPNPTHQALKTDPTRRVGLGWVGFGGLLGFLHTPNIISIVIKKICEKLCVGVISPMVYIYVYIGSMAQSENIK